MTAPFSFEQLSTPPAPVVQPSLRRTEPTRLPGSAPTVRSDRLVQTTNVASLDDLTPADWQRWIDIRRDRPEFRSPFFSPGFAKAVQQARGDVSVVVVRKGDSPIAFLPFHRVGQTGYPVGRFFNDAQNLIAPSDSAVTWDGLLRKVNLKSFEFHALVGVDPESLSTHTCHDVVQSFHCDIGDDSAEYLRRLGKAHKTIGRQGQKNRKLERECGPLSFEIDCKDKDLFHQTLRWKRAQYQRSHILDLFTPPWTIRMMESLFDQPSDSVNGARGILSVLRAGDQVIAAHYGMIENGLLHYWFPAYDPAFGKYSPGTGLFCEILREASEHGIQCVDMGYGEQPYKLKQTDSSGRVLQGCFTHSAVHRYRRCTQAHLIRLAKRVPGKEPIKRFWRSFFPDAGIAKLG